MTHAKKSEQPRRAKPKPAVVRVRPPRRVPALSLGTVLSIREVSERQRQLQAMLQAGAAEVDAGALASIDTAGLQLLLAAAAAAQARGLKLKLIGGEKLLQGAARALGLAEHLGAAAEVLA